MTVIIDDKERELILVCLEYCKNRLNDGHMASIAHRIAGRCTYKRIDELIVKLNEASK